MELRKSIVSDVENIMVIIRQAQVSLKERGVNQWQNGYPNEDTIIGDISRGESYVLVKNGEVIATTMITFEEDTFYEKIYDGEWLNDGKYATIHRIAVCDEYKGLGISSQIILQTEELCRQNNIPSIKIDTHKENIPMRKVIEKNGFKYCGIVYVDGNSERVAFEKLLYV